MTHDLFDESNLISSYTRREMIENGELIDVSEPAREAGIRYPTALTAAAWQQCVAVPRGVTGQDERGRLWDVLFLLAVRARASSGDTIHFQLHVRNDNRERTPPLVQLKAICGPGDDAEPVITVMLPDED
jgi:hypothetical protein